MGNIATKITKGTIEITNDVHLITAGDKVGMFEAALLNMLKISPFTYGLVVKKVYETGSGMEPEKTSFFQALNIATKITKGTNEITSDMHLTLFHRVQSKMHPIFQKLINFSKCLKHFFFAMYFST